MNNFYPGGLIMHNMHVGLLIFPWCHLTKICMICMLGYLSVLWGYLSCHLGYLSRL